MADDPHKPDETNERGRKMSTTNSEQTRSKVIACLEDYEKQLRTAGMEVEANQIREKIEEYLRGLFSVIFTGAFDAGKSTTLNALMRQNLLTVSINPETPVITKIINGRDSDQAVVKYRDPKRPDEVIPLSEFGEKYRLEFLNEGKFAEVSYVELTRELKTSTVAFVDSPGLGNTTTDDAAANEFAEKADAIVFMMHATMAMDDKAKMYMERNFRRRHLKNVFIVVNWYNMVQPQYDEKFRQKLEHDLYDVFTDENGDFDRKLYKSRVFLVDSFTSFCARTGTPKKERIGVTWVDKPVTPEMDQYSGIPEFEEALYAFLEDEDRDIQGYEGFMPRMAGMFRATWDHVQEVIEQSDMNTDELKKKEQGQKAAIEEISKHLADINKAVEDALREMLVDIQGEYQTFSTSVANHWIDHFKGQKIPFGMKEEMKIFGLKAKHKIQDIFNKDGADQLARDREFEKLMAPITTQVETYIHGEAEKMAGRISVICEPIFQRLADRLRRDIENIRDVGLENFDFEKLVTDVVVAGKQGADSALKGIKVNGGTDVINRDMSLIQALISGPLLFNFDDMVSDAMGGKKSWGTFIKNSLLKETGDVILAIIISSIFPPAWIYYAARAAWGVLTMQQQAEGIGTQILLGMKEETVQSITDAREEVSVKIESSFEKELVYNCNELTGAIELGLRQNQKQLQALIEEREAGEFNAEAKRKELEEIIGNMVEGFNDLARLLGKSSFTEEQIMELATQKG